MKKMPIRLAAIGEPASSPMAVLFGLQPFFERLVTSLADRLQCNGQWAQGNVPWFSPLIAPSATANANIQLVLD